MLRMTDLEWPIIQAPMAGVATPRLAAAVSNAGGLGSLGVGATNADGAREMIHQLKTLTDKPFNVNLFVHEAPTRDEEREAAWLDWLAPHFRDFEAHPPQQLSSPYTSFLDDRAMLSMLLETRPPVLSFHFGLPSAHAIDSLHSAGITLMATATCLEEAKAIEAAGLDGIIAQGIEAGGHRGVFDPTAVDEKLETIELTRLLVRETALPIIAAGGIMDGAGIARALEYGAIAAQLGTAFIACPESSADDAYRDALLGPAATETCLTSVISGRPARTLRNRFTALEQDAISTASMPIPPDYPLTYYAGKALHASGKAKGVHGFGAHWAGQGAPLARAIPAEELMRVLVEEWQMASQSSTLPN